MPDREYYLDASPRMTEMRAKYQAHVAAVLELAHVKEAAAKAARIVELEKKIAVTHATREEVGDAEKGNNHWSRKDLDAKAPGLDWNAFLTAAGLDKQTVFVLWSPKAVTGLAALVASQPLDVWKDYLAFHALDHASPFLPQGVRRRALRVPRQGRERRRAAPRALEARRRSDQRRARRGRGQALRRPLLPGLGEDARAGDGEEPDRRVRTSRRRARLDEPRDQDQGEGEARDPRGRRRLSGSLPRLHGARRRPCRRARQQRARRAVRAPSQPEQARQADRSHRVGDDPAARQRGEPAGAERAAVPRGDPPAPALRPRALRGRELRRDRRDHRPRDQPLLRRPGRALRRHGQDVELVDGGGPRALQGLRRGAREAVRRVPAVPRCVA